MVFLDEPSAAIDVCSKREVWNSILNRDRNQTIMFTSHSMEEVEALCDRITIQVKGQLRCLGTAIHLKGKYGHGYRVEVIFNTEQNTDENATRMRDFMRHHLDEECEILQSRGAAHTYQIQGKPLTIFRVLQANKEVLGIMEYIVTRQTLEEVFLKFAREQNEL